MVSQVPELEHARSWFECWREPRVFSDHLSRVRPLLERGRFLYVREGRWYREAWTLNAYSKFCSFDAIRLNRDDPPDAFIRLGGSEIPIEITEVLEPKRKPASEYRGAGPEFSLDPGENWVKRADELPGALQAGIEKKAKGAYPRNTELLIYLNINEYGIKQKTIESQIHIILAGQTSPFALIHVLWKDKLFSSDGGTKTNSNFDEFDDDWDDQEVFDSVFKD